MSASQKYEPVTSNMIFSDWRTVFAPVLSKIGQLDNFVLSDIDKSTVEDFSSKFVSKIKTTGK